MKHLIIDMDNFYSADINAYKYALTLDPISLIPVRSREAMNKQVIVKARRHNRGALVSNDIDTLNHLLSQYGGYLYDMVTIKKLNQNTKGCALEEWCHTGETTTSPHIHLGTTPNGKSIIFHSGRDDFTVTILNIHQLKGDLS